MERFGKTWPSANGSVASRAATLHRVGEWLSGIGAAKVRVETAATRRASGALQALNGKL